MRTRLLCLAVLIGATVVAGMTRSYAAPPASATSTAPYAARFTETRSIPGMKTPLVLHGTIRFTPGNRLVWAVRKPYTYRFEISEGMIEETFPDGSTHTKPLAETPWAQALFKLFSALFSGDPHALARYFDLNPAAEGMTLTPRSKVLAQWVARIVVVGKPLPRTVTIVGSDGGETRLEFTSLKPVRLPAPATAGQ